MGWRVCVQLLGEGVKRPTLALFLLYMNESGINPQSLIPSQPLMIPTSQVIFFVRWYITLQFPPWWLPPSSLRGIGRLSWNPPISLHFYFSVFFWLSSSPAPTAKYLLECCLLWLLFYNNNIYGVPVNGWIVCAAAMWEISHLNPRKGRQKKLFGGREPFE